MFNGGDWVSRGFFLFNAKFHITSHKSYTVSITFYEKYLLYYILLGSGTSFRSIGAFKREVSKQSCQIPLHTIKEQKKYAAKTNLTVLAVSEIGYGYTNLNVKLILGNGNKIFAQKKNGTIVNSELWNVCYFFPWNNSIFWPVAYTWERQIFTVTKFLLINILN